MEDETSVCVALLHDVVEDHGDKYSFEFLQNDGFGEEIITARKLLTHVPAVPYMDYIRQIGEIRSPEKSKSLI